MCLSKEKEREKKKEKHLLVSCGVLSVMVFGPVTMSSFGSCLGSGTGIPLNDATGCLFRHKQGIPDKFP